ncbi:hypothetical protein F4677DRAFT_464498 [Hypoxylon crocopeplum]|nr:hypothetical protein F4677DRAFT_464498 [Hypoxylon crocopeplum]
MSNISSLPQASRRTVEDFLHRSEFWLRVPGNERDRFWRMDSPGRSYSHTAPEVVKFTEANCLTARAVNNSDLNEFKRKLQTDWEKSRTTPFEGMDLATLLGEYAVWIDHLFFFGLITRPARQDGILDGERPIIEFEFRDGIEDGDGNELEGTFLHRTGQFLVNMLQSSGKFQPFEKALCVIVHELVHVYLHVLAWDNDAGSYLIDIHQDNGHGVQFHELLQFILTQLFKWMPTMTEYEFLFDGGENVMTTETARTTDTTLENCRTKIELLLKLNGPLVQGHPKEHEDVSLTNLVIMLDVPWPTGPIFNSNIHSSESFFHD